MRKIILISLTILATICIYVSCSKDDSPAESLAKPFVLTPKEVNIPLKETATLTITSGNGQYRIVQTDESKQIVQLSLANQNTNVLVEALKSGATTATLIDLKSKAEITLTIQVIIPPSYYELSEDKKTLIKWKNNQEQSLDFSSDPVLKEITTIGEGAFKDNDALKEVILPQKVTFVAKEAFASVSQLETIKLPNTVSAIGEGVFSGCTALKEVILPENESFTKIPKKAFEDCKSLKTIQLPNTIDEIGILAFADAGLTQVTLPQNLITISQQAFVGNKELKEITIPKNVTLISLAAFQETALTTVKVEATFPPTLSFGTDASTHQAIEPFPSATLQEIIVPETVTQTYRDKDGWHNYARLINKNKAFKHLEIIPKEVTLFVDEVKQLEIVSGNDDYDLQREEATKEIAFIGITDNQKILGIRGKKAGAFKVAVIDKVTQEKVELSITVLNPFVLSPRILNINVGETATVIVDGNGEYEIPTNSYVSLTLSNDKKKLFVKGIKAGETQVEIKDKKANRTLNFTIKIAEVAPSVKEFSLSQQQLTLKLGEEKTIAIQGNDTYELETSQTSQLTLSSDKKSLTIKAIKSGEERITIKDTKANKVISIQITVFKKLKLTPTSISLKEGETKSVTIEGNGDYVVINGQYASGTLSENKETLQIHGKAVGNGKVLVKDNKSKEEVFVEVTVTEKIKEFSLSPTMLNLTVEETAIVIIEGNGEYEIPTNSYVALTLSNDKKKLSVKGIKAGETQVEIKDKKANKSLTLTVKVAQVAPPMKEFSLSQQQLTLKVGDEKTIAIQGNDIYELGTSQMAQCTLSSDKKTLAVKAIKAGEETLKIKDVTANKELTVQLVVLNKLKVTPTSVSLKVGETQSVTIEGNGQYWVISGQYADGNLSEDKQSLQIKGKKAGQGKIILKDRLSQEELEVMVTVAENLKEFSITPTSITLNEEETKTVRIKGNGDYEITNDEYAEAMYNEEKAEELQVYGKQPGKGKIKILDKKSGKEIFLQVTVKEDLKEFEIDPESLNIKIGETATVNIMGNDNYTIGTSSYFTAELSQNKQHLTIKGIKEGNGKITIKDNKANKTLQLTVAVTAVLKPFRIEPSMIDFKVGETRSVALEGNGQYEFGTSSLVEVLSSTEHLVIFRAKKEGTGVVTIKDVKAGKTLDLTVKVTKALVPFSISPSSVRVKVGQTQVVTIIGNGKYQLSKTENPYAELTLNEVAGTLTVKGVKKGQIELYVRDLNSITEEKEGKKGKNDGDSEDNKEAENYESRKLTITVIPATEEKQYNLSWDKYSIDKWLDTDAQEVDMTQIDELKSIGMVGEAAFKGLTNLKKVILPNTIEVIDREAFANCTALTSIKLGGNKLDEIGNNAFSGCTKLTRIDIPKNVSRIRGGAFDDCNALQTIILRHTEVAPFHNELGYLNVTIYVPDNLVEEYRKDMDWEPYKDKIKPISELTGRKIRK
nr:leucine-rich repeat protein [uncultured Capnocytophaga sp.]